MYKKFFGTITGNIVMDAISHFNKIIETNPSLDFYIHSFSRRTLQIECLVKSTFHLIIFEFHWVSYTSLPVDFTNPQIRRVKPGELSDYFQSLEDEEVVYCIEAETKSSKTGNIQNQEFSMTTNQERI